MAYLLKPAHQPQPGTELVQRIDWTPGGLGCACETKGMGLFDSGLDISGWGFAEMAVAGLGAYMVLSTIFTTGRAVRKVRALPGERRKRRAASLRKQASELTKKK